MKLSNSNISDEMLWNAIKNGDEMAFKLIFERYLPTLLATSRRYLRDEEACENVVQDIFLNIWFKRENLDIKDFRSYFTASARYEVYKVLRVRNSPHAMLYTSDHLENNYAYQANEAEESFNVSDLKAQLSKHLQALPKRCREIFLLSRQEQLSNHEIATRLNISKRSVENQITTALHHLRMNMGDYAPAHIGVIVSVLIATGTH